MIKSGISLHFHVVRKRVCLILFIISLCLTSPACYSLGLKVIRDYPTGILSNSMTWQIDAFDDWMFAATEDGLVQFDGTLPELFQFNNRRAIRSVNFDKTEGKLYAGGINEFGYFISSPTQSLEYVCLSDSVGSNRYIGNIWGIYPHDGRVTLQADASILIYDNNTGKHSVIKSDSKLDCSNLVNGVLWIGSQDGLKFLMGNTIANAPGAEELKGKRIRGILPYGEGVLVVTSDGIWSYLNHNLEKLSYLDANISELGEVFSSALHEGRLALGSVGHGLGIIDLATGEMKIYDEESGLASNTVLSLKFDMKGDLWAGMQFGMGKILLTLPVERLDNTSIPIGSGYVMALNQDKLFLGTNRGLYSIDYDPRRDLENSPIRQISGLSGQVWGLSFVDGDLFCCHDRGLFILNKNGSYEQIGDVTGVWDVQKLGGSSDRAYIGTYFGLQTIRKVNGKWKLEPPIEGYDFSSYNFAQESPVILWNDDSEGGINRIEIDTLNNRVIQVKNFTETADGFPLTADVFISKIDNDIYFSTNNGLYVYDKKNDRIIKDRHISDLIGNPQAVSRVKKINGSLYALTPNELIEADPAGILNRKRIPISQAAARPMHDKDLFAAIGKDYIGYPIRSGYLLFDFSNNLDSLSSGYYPEVRINSVKATMQKDSVIFRNNFSYVKNIPELKYSENSIKIEFGSPEAADRGLLYSTRLNNEPWSSPSPAIAKEYTDLREGKYKFEVKAISPNGKFTTDTFVFKVLPPWWRSSWMKAGYLFLILGITILAFLLEQKRVNRKQQHLARQKDREIALRQEEHRKETEEKDRRIIELEREKLDKELRHKAQEVANVMLSLSHKNETLLTVKKELRDILGMLPRSNPEAREAVQSLQNKVNIDLRSDDVLKRVEEEFDIIHDNFMKKLRAAFPDLNNNEVLLCAYIKMDLSTKEIAPLMNISTRGVETMRYRLRKKLNLDRDASLTEFLSKDLP